MSLKERDTVLAVLFLFFFCSCLSHALEGENRIFLAFIVLREPLKGKADSSIDVMSLGICLDPCFC